jgi:FkbM family methyltransferase
MKVYAKLLKYGKKVNMKYVYIALFLILIIWIVYCMYDMKNGVMEKYENDNNFMEFIKNHIFYNEKDEVIDHKNNEIDEQYQAYKFIKPKDVVLELGGRYGTVSVVINKMVEGNDSHVVVEPDENIIPSLEKNKKINKSNFTILPKFISNKNKKIIYDGYGTRVEDSEKDEGNNKKISYQEFREMYPQQFNVLVADCEGCLCEFLEMMGDDFQHLTKVIFEADQTHLCDYEKIKEKLKNAGFVEKDNNHNFRFVYIKGE